MENLNETIDIESNVDSARKLATIQVISDLNPIPEADSIEVAKILGWNVVVKKGEFKIGDYCIYCEIDSVLPETSWSEFLRKNGFRIKTVKLRKQISQGICFPLSIIENINNVKEGEDVTEILGITKYIPKPGSFDSGYAKGRFPIFIPKTDETRIQNLKPLVSSYIGTECIITEKIDGCSSTYFFKDEEFGVCSRNLEIKEDESNAFWRMAKKYSLNEKLKKLGRNIAFQGEIAGPNIQGNKLQLKELDLFIFDVYDIDKQEYLEPKDSFELIYFLELNYVPIINNAILLHDNIDEWVNYSERKSELNSEVWVEGIIIRSLDNINDYELIRKIGSNRISLKVINPSFLLKYD